MDWNVCVLLCPRLLAAEIMVDENASTEQLGHNQGVLSQYTSFGWKSFATFWDIDLFF